MTFLTYLDHNGASVFVSRGISGSSSWFTVRQKNSKSGTNRIKSKDLPIRHSKEEAQQDLDAYAKKHRWKEWKPQKAHGLSKDRETNKPTEKLVALCAYCLPLFQESFPFYEIDQGESGAGKCGVCGKKKDILHCAYRRKAA